MTRSTSLSPEVKTAINYTADRAAAKAVRTTLLSIGIDTSTGESMREHQQDMHLLRRLRVASEAKSLKIYIALIAAGLSLFNSLLVLGVQYMIQAGTTP